MPQTQKGFVSILTVALLVFLIAAVLWGFIYFEKQPVVSQQLPQRLQLPSVATSATPGAIQTYSNESLGLSFNYPKAWQLKVLNLKTETVLPPLLAPNIKLLHSVLTLNPADYTGQTPPIELIYFDNPSNLSLSDLDKKLTGVTNQPLVYSADDNYILTGAGLTGNLRSSGTCGGKNCQIYTFSIGKKVYQFENFLDVNAFGQSDVFNQVVNSFKVVDQTDQSVLPISTSSAIAK